MIEFYISLAFIFLGAAAVTCMVGTMVWDYFSDDDFYWQERR